MSQKKLKGNFIPNLFDLPEIWRLNTEKYRYFNILFLPMYIIMLPALLCSTIMDLIETYIGKSKNDNTKCHANMTIPLNGDNIKITLTDGTTISGVIERIMIIEHRLHLRVMSKADSVVLIEYGRISSIEVG